jgi:hypothetical protein
LVQNLSVRKFQMNWKILLVIAGLSLSAGLTACNKEAAPDAPKTETTTPGAEAPKPGDAPKTGAEAPKPGDAPKTGTDMKSPTAKPGDKKPDAPKKP